MNDLATQFDTMFQEQAKKQRKRAAAEKRAKPLIDALLAKAPRSLLAYFRFWAFIVLNGGTDWPTAIYLTFSLTNANGDMAVAVGSIDKMVAAMETQGWHICELPRADIRDYETKDIYINVRAKQNLTDGEGKHVVAMALTFEGLRDTPMCHIEEREVVIAAVPEHIEKRPVLICEDGEEAK